MAVPKITAFFCRQPADQRGLSMPPHAAEQAMGGAVGPAWRHFLHAAILACMASDVSQQLKSSKGESDVFHRFAAQPNLHLALRSCACGNTSGVKSEEASLSTTYAQCTARVL